MVEETEWFHRELQHTEVRTIDPAQIASEIGSGVYFGAQVDETSAALHPAKYVFGLARAAANAGALLVENAAVMAIRRDEVGWLADHCQGRPARQRDSAGDEWLHHRTGASGAAGRLSGWLLYCGYRTTFARNAAGD